MTPHHYWLQGMVYGVITTAVACVFLVLHSWVSVYNRSALSGLWFVLFPLLLAGNLWLWQRTREDVVIALSRRKKPPVIAPPTDDLLDEYLRCHRQLWRLSVRGQDDSEEAEELRVRMAACWKDMSVRQRIKAEQEKGDAWKHLYDDEEQ